MEDGTTRPDYEPAPPVADPAQEQPKFGAAQRLWMVFTSPAEVFADIGIKPTWALALILMIALGVVVQLVLIPHVDLEATIRTNLGSRADGLSDEQIDNIVEGQQKFAKFGPLIAIVIGPIAWAIMAAVFLVMLKIVGSEIDFVKTLSTALHAYWPPSLVLSVLTMVLIQRAGQVPQQELGNVVKAHPGAFMTDAPAWLSAAASTFSVFNIWTAIMLVLGFKIVGKLSTGKAAVAALVPWGVWIVLKSGLAMIPEMFR
jgi:hypothetical protein